MAITITATDVVAVQVWEQDTAPCDEVISAGQMARISTTTGKFTKTKADEGRCRGMCISAGTPAGMAVTVVKNGLIDLGTALGDCDYDMDIYLDDTDGAIGTAAGTGGTVIIGYVAPGWGYTTADKLLRVNL